MKKNATWMLAVAAALALILAVAPTAARAEGGIKLFVVHNRGIEEKMSADQVKQRNQLCDFLEEDLVRRLEKAGWSPTVIKSKDEFKPAAGSYLLEMTIMKYNPGSAAARHWVGFGAGAATLDIHYELFKDGPEPAWANNNGVGSGRDWRPVCSKLNKELVEKLKGQLK